MKYPDIVLMDESEEKVVSCRTPEYSEIVFKWVASESGHPEGSDTEAGVGEEVACCNGDDIMVEVLGSHVYVDGICTTDGGGTPGSNSIDEAVCVQDNNGEACCLEDNFRRLSGEGQEVVLGSDYNASKLKSIQEEAVRKVECRNDGYRPLTEGFSALNAVSGGNQGSEEEKFSPGTDTSQADMDIGEEMEVGKQVNDCQKAILDGDQELQINGGSVVSETVGEDSANICVVQSFVADVGEADMKNNNDSTLNGDHAMSTEEDQNQMSGDGHGHAMNADSDGLHMGIKETVLGTQHYDLHPGQQMEVEEQKLDPEQPRNAGEDTITLTASTPGTPVEVYQPMYLLPPEDHEFFVSDLVWGEVGSNLWWPGQILDPSDASEKATEHQKKDSFLVAYFGDQTFAWNEASLLRPFRAHFSLAVNHVNSEAFCNAVDCALEEVSRRVQMGLTCSCLPKDIYEKIKFQVAKSTGIRKGSSLKDASARSFTADSFEPDKLLEYTKALAQCPSGGRDRFDLVLAKAQLSSFYCWSGYHPLPEFQSGRGFVENGANNSIVEESRHFSDLIEHASPMNLDDQLISSLQEKLGPQRGFYHKLKHDLTGGLYPCKRKRSLSDVMGETFDSLDTEGSDGKPKTKLGSPSYGMECKSLDSLSEEMQEARENISLSKVSQSKEAFRVGKWFSGVASQITVSPSVSKGTKDRLQKLSEMNGVAVNGVGRPCEILEDAIAKRSSFDGVLSELLLAACDPLKDVSFHNSIISFFHDFRNSFVLDQLPVDQEGRKRKRFSNSHVTSAQTYEFEEINDTYWTDRIVQNESKGQLPTGNGQGEYDILAVEFEKEIQKGSKHEKHYCEGNQNVIAEKPLGHVNKRTPAELVLTFSDLRSIPSVSKLNKMFRHFGPLKEPETEVDFETSRARVIFRRCTDAEVALNSAEKFSIFGAASVDYKLNYSISESFRASLYAPALPAETPMMNQTLRECTACIGSTMSNHGPFVATTLGEETSLMVSTLCSNGLPVPPSFREENSCMMVMLGEKKLNVTATIGEESFPVWKTERVEMLASGISAEGMSRVSETNGEQTRPVANTVDERMISATTLSDQISTRCRANIEPTSTVDTFGEQSWITPTSGVEERSMMDINMNGNYSVTTSVGGDPPTRPTTMGEEASVEARTDGVQPLVDTARPIKKVSIIGMPQSQATVGRNSGDGTLDETSSTSTTVMTTVVETATSVVTTLSKVVSTVMMTMDESTSTPTTASDGETASAAASRGIESAL